MKQLLPEYFQPSDEEIKEIWQNATIVLDANVLLNFFRYSKNSREYSKDQLVNLVAHK